MRYCTFYQQWISVGHLQKKYEFNLKSIQKLMLYEITLDEK